MKIKHLLTRRCHVGCLYCLEKNVTAEEIESVQMISDMYHTLHNEGYRVIDLTGGESTMHKHFVEISGIACDMFDEVHLYTSDHLQYNRFIIEDLFTTVNYGFHNQIRIEDLPVVITGIPVYMQTMHYHYKDNMAEIAKKKGFLGLSINTDKHLREVSFDRKMPDLEGFSIRINDNDCYAEGTLLMPDLSVVKDVGQYLDKNLTIK